MFPYAQNVNVNRSTLADVQGDFNYNIQITSNVSLGQDLDSRIHAMYNATASGAAYDAEERVPPARCHPGTRVEILKETMGFIKTGGDGQGERLIWLHGPAGSGKSAIAQTIAERCASLGYLAASFFFSRGQPRRASNQYLFPTIAYQLSISIPELRPFVLENFADDPSIIGKSTNRQVQKLIVDPLQKLLSKRTNGTTTAPYLVVIDGLDECDGHAKQLQILDQIIHIVETYQLPLLFLIVSRPERQIEIFFENIEDRNLTRQVSLYGDHQSYEDVRRYLQDHFDRIRSSPIHWDTFSLIHEPWPSQKGVDTVVHRSDGYFIYAATLVRYVDDDRFSPVERLNEALDASPSGSGPFRELDNLYQQILSVCPNTERLKQVLGFILGATDSGGMASPSQPLITDALRLQPDQLPITLRGLRSIISHDPDNNTLHSGFKFHASFPDFIFDPHRSGVFYIDRQRNHKTLSYTYLSCLKRWRNDRAPPEFSLQTSMHFLFHLHKAGAPSSDMIEELTATDLHFWDFHARACRLPFAKLTPGDVVIHLLSAAIDVARALDPGPSTLFKHFFALRQIALRWMIGWASAFGNRYVQFDKMCHESIQNYFLYEYPFISQLVLLHTRDPIWHFGLYEGLHEVFSQQERLMSFDCDIQIVHAGLAMHCFHVLELEPEELRNINNWKSIYTYARIFWAGHLFRASRDDADVLLGLRHIQERRPFGDFNLLEAACSTLWKPVPLFNVTENSDPLTQVIMTRRFLVNRGLALIHLLDEFDSNGWHEDPVYLEIDDFSKSDWLNAKLVLMWLKKMREPPADLVSRWEIHCEERLKVSGLQEDEMFKLSNEIGRLSAPPQPRAPFPQRAPFLRRAMDCVAQLLWGSRNPKPKDDPKRSQSATEPRIYMI